jgi:hypothetical protein
MTPREQYDALAAKLKADWDKATKTPMTGTQWDAVTAKAKAGEDKLRSYFP